MGVRGLSTFLFDDGQFFKRSRLGKEKVVIGESFIFVLLFERERERKNVSMLSDGNNLRYALYASTKGLNPSLGGDYDKYYQSVRQHFLM